MLFYAAEPILMYRKLYPLFACASLCDSRLLCRTYKICRLDHFLFIIIAINFSTFKVKAKLNVVACAGIDAFKEIARLATHTILAACGLEHRKSEAYSLPGVVCTHTGRSKQLSKSNLMPKSCQQCFHVFVKNIVNSIMFHKVVSANVAL